MPEKTYELRLSFEPATAELVKEQLKETLLSLGVDSFVEAAIDGLDIDFEEVNLDALLAVEEAAASSSLSVFKYDRAYLEDLGAKLAQQFAAAIHWEIIESDTVVWTEGWKDSFQPIETKLFWIYPPWNEDQPPPGKQPLVMDPGMAFGTGQHATTQLCLNLLEDLCADGSVRSLIDVGAGTGILSIAAAKLGVQHIVATDIDPDAILAIAANAKANQVAIAEVIQGSVPEHRQADVVVANILTVVLRRLLPELAHAVSDGGALILSGVLSEEAEELVQQATAYELQLAKKAVQDGWCGLVLTRAR